jgi:hypothetical protein
MWSGDTGFGGSRRDRAYQTPPRHLHDVAIPVKKADLAVAIHSAKNSKEKSNNEVESNERCERCSHDSTDMCRGRRAWKVLH